MTLTLYFGSGFFNDRDREAGSLCSRWGRDAQSFIQLRSVTTVGLRRPCSSPLMYCWLKPDHSSICSKRN